MYKWSKADKDNVGLIKRNFLAGSNIRELNLYLFYVNIFCWVQSLGLRYDFKLFDRSCSLVKTRQIMKKL